MLSIPQGFTRCVFRGVQGFSGTMVYRDEIEGRIMECDTYVYTWHGLADAMSNYFRLLIEERTGETSGTGEFSGNARFVNGAIIKADIDRAIDSIAPHKGWLKLSLATDWDYLVRGLHPIQRAVIDHFILGGSISLDAIIGMKQMLEFLNCDATTDEETTNE